MKRRDFLRAAGGAAGGAAAASGAAAAQEETTTSSNTTSSNTTTTNGTTTGNETTSGGGGGGGGGVAKTVTVGPGGNLVFDPETVYVAPGQTVEWVWDSDGHNVEVESQPDEANWEGTPGGASQLYDTGYSYTHTFETLGTYEYVCTPHAQAGMVGSVIVNESGQAPGAGQKTLNPEHMGVPFQAHYVGIATIVMIMVSLVYSFFVLKYGESPNTSGGNR